MSASFLCAVHCTVLPFLVPLMAISGFGFLWQPAFEIFMIVFALVVGGLSLGSGYLHKHHKKYPLFLLLGGIAVLLLTKLWPHHHDSFLHPLEIAALVTGAAMIIAAHVSNSRLSRHCPACSCKH